MSRIVRANLLRLVALGLTAQLTLTVASAGSRQITVRETLNQTYGRELVSYPFTAEAGDCIEDSLVVTSPEGPVPAQFSDIQRHTDRKGSVASARLYFVVEGLEPGQTRQYQVSWGKKKARAATGTLTVKEARHTVELSTDVLTIRLPLGQGEGEAPAPLLGMRLGDGAWTPASEWAGDALPTQWSAELTESGPVFARVTTTYTFADAGTATFVATVIDGDSAMRWEMAVQGDRPDTLVHFQLPAVPGVKQALLPKGYGQWARERKQAFTAPAVDFCRLSPNASLVNIFADHPHRIVLEAGGRSLELASRDPAAWVEPGPPQTYRGADGWNLSMIESMWEGWRRKAMPVSYAADGAVTLTASLAEGGRKWSVSAGAPRVGDQLGQRNEMVLDWPATAKHPCLFVDMPHIQGVWKKAAGQPKAEARLNGRWAAAALKVIRKPAAQRTEAEIKQVVDTLRERLGKLGRYDVMRGAIAVVSLFDALVDSDLLTPAERALFRAQTAYLAYLMADPMCWSSERGYGSGNPNMHCSYTLSLGIIACALRDHPMAQQWANHATAWMEKWLSTEVGPDGNWLCEGSHYGIVSLEPLMTYAIAAKRAGFHDFTTDPRLKNVMLYFAKYHTPPDPRRGNRRVTGSYGRGTSSDALAICGIAARMTAESDPAYAKTMQWMWAQSGFPGHVGDFRLGGYEAYYLDPDLPVAAPAWHSETFSGLGSLLRAGFATPHESYVNLLACVDSQKNLDVWTPGVGGLSQWYGRGQPISTCFTFDTGYKVRHELLRDGVRLARNYKPGDTMVPFGFYTETHFDTHAALPQADYVRTRIVNTEPDNRDWPPPEVPAYPQVTPAKSATLDWTRQVLFLKDDDPAGPAYLVLRDTTHGGEPTAWQFWTLSEKLGTPAEAADLDAFLADKPGTKSLLARKLAAGDRYTALGQFGMDVEYFIAGPAKTPRHTLRYGGTYRNVPEFQDLLHLEQPGDGTYFVAVYPRPRAETAPTFTRLADGKVIRTAGAFGTDHAFLSAEPATAEADGASFSGTAAAVQQRAKHTHLTLGAGGEVGSAGTTLAAPFAATLTVAPGVMTLALPAGSAGGELVIQAAGAWVAEAAAGVEVTAADKGLLVKVPKGAVRVVLKKKG